MCPFYTRGERTGPNGRAMSYHIHKKVGFGFMGEHKIGHVWYRSFVNTVTLGHRNEFRTWMLKLLPQRRNPYWPWSKENCNIFLCDLRYNRELVQGGKKPITPTSRFRMITKRKLELVTRAHYTTALVLRWGWGPLAPTLSTPIGMAWTEYAVCGNGLGYTKCRLTCYRMLHILCSYIE